MSIIPSQSKPQYNPWFSISTIVNSSGQSTQWSCEKYSSNPQEKHTPLSREAHMLTLWMTVWVLHTPAFLHLKVVDTPVTSVGPFLEFLFSTLCKTHMQINPFLEITTAVRYAIEAIDVAPTHQPSRWSARINPRTPPIRVTLSQPMRALPSNPNFPVINTVIKPFLSILTFRFLCLLSPFQCLQ